MSDYIKREDAIKAFEPRQRRDWYTPWIVETLEGAVMAKRIVKHKKHEFTTAVGAGNDAAKNFCDRILQNPAVNKESILVDVYQSRSVPFAPPMDEHVKIEWDEIEMQREPNKERRQSKWRRRTRWINTQMS